MYDVNLVDVLYPEVLALYGRFDPYLSKRFQNIFPFVWNEKRPQINMERKYQTKFLLHNVAK